MAAIVPPPGPPPAGTAGGAGVVAPSTLQALGEVVVEQVPERIANLARTILLSGTIISQQEGGALLVRTQVGEILIRTQTPLPLDKVLTLQIPPGAPPVRAQVSIALPPAAASAAAAPVLAIPGAPVASPQPPAATPPSSLVLPRTQQQPNQQQNSPAASQPGPAVSVTSPRPGAAPVVVSPLALQAIAQAPLLSGSVLPAQVLAVPEYNIRAIETQVMAKLVLPPAIETQAQLQQTGVPALRSLVSQGLADILAKLPPSVFLPPAGEVDRADRTDRPAPALPQAATPPAAQRAATPAAFSSLPVMLTLPPGSSVTVQVISVVPPDQSDIQPPTSPAPVAPSVSKAQTAAPATTLPATTLPATTLAQPLSSLAMPEPKPAQATAPSFTSVIVGQTAQREPIATSPAGLFVLDSKAPLPVGTKIELSLVHVSEPAPDLAADILERAPRDWPVLQQALFTLGAQAPQQASARLVKPEAMGTATLFLMAALRIGKPQAFFGDELMQALRAQGQGEMLTRMAGELQQMAQNWSKPEAPLTEWRSLLLPLMPQGQLTRLAIHTRHEREAGTPEDQPGVRRLVVELELSRLGPLLLDGYIRHKSMDMTLRSQRSLQKDLKDELRVAYRDTLSALGWSGAMEFQTATELWLGR